MAQKSFSKVKGVNLWQVRVAELDFDVIGLRRPIVLSVGGSPLLTS